MGNVDSHTLGKSSRRYSFKEIPCSLRVTRVRNEGVHAELVQREIEPLDISHEHPQRLFWLLALATGAHQRCYHKQIRPNLGGKKPLVDINTLIEVSTSQMR